MNQKMTADDENLTVSGLSKSFGGLKAVQDLDFKVKTGTILGMIGPNGAGKTTVFNLITGFIQPDRGSITWKGANLLGLKTHQIVNRGIARTFQLVKPFPELSLRDNLRVACFCPRFKRRHPGYQNMEEIINEVATRVGLPANLDQMAANLGHGDLRLLDIARALIIEPELLLLDEPLSGLSSIETQKIVKFIQNLNKQNLTIFIIEHKLKELMKIAHQIVAIDFGVKLTVGTPEEVVVNPKVIEAYLGGRKEHVTA